MLLPALKAKPTFGVVECGLENTCVTGGGTQVLGGASDEEEVEGGKEYGI
jgi:hypothetical protein